MYTDFKFVTDLELAEAYAELNGMQFDCEEAVTDAFNEDIRPSVVERYGEDDTVAINEAFNNWTDGLCRDGLLHETQYNEYTYLDD